MEFDEALIEELRSHYGVGPRYAQAYLGLWQQAKGQTFKTLHEILDLPAPAPMWFDYALSTNYRGRQLYQVLSPFLPEGVQRYLDIGSGFGGCLVAFGEQGMETCGIEIDPQRIELAKANCRDFQVGATLSGVSILEDHIDDRLGAFDVITCTDVVEHVLDVPRALQNMARLLRPKGVLILEIPNKDSLFFVASDGHFNFFGITLLPRSEAVAYYSQFFTAAYDVGDYQPLNFYEEHLRERGLDFQIISPSYHPIRNLNETDQLVSSTLRSYRQFLIERGRKLPDALFQKIKLRFATYMNHLLSDLSKIPDGTAAVEDFRRRYLTDFWTLIVSRK